MWSSTSILHLYARILDQEILNNHVNESEFRLGIEAIKKAYHKPSLLCPSIENGPVADYNNIAVRCAYLHKQAAFHTAMVYEIFGRILSHNPRIARTFDGFLRKDQLKICSLGSGPGSDVIGALAALHDCLGLFHSSVKLVDMMSKWEGTFLSIVLQLSTEFYGSLGRSVGPEYFKWSYLTNNLLDRINPEVDGAIGQADFVTMVKFVSAAAGTDTLKMLKNIFRATKPGALVLFMDSSAGGFHELVINAAADCKLIHVFGPRNHENYVNETFCVEKFGYKGCSVTKVSVQLMLKVHPLHYSEEMHRIAAEFCRGPDFSYRPRTAFVRPPPRPLAPNGPIRSTNAFVGPPPRPLAPNGPIRPMDPFVGPPSRFIAEYGPISQMNPFEPNGPYRPRNPAVRSPRAIDLDRRNRPNWQTNSCTETPPKMFNREPNGPTRQRTPLIKTPPSPIPQNSPPWVRNARMRNCPTNGIVRPPPNYGAERLPNGLNGYLPNKQNGYLPNRKLQYVDEAQGLPNGRNGYLPDGHVNSRPNRKLQFAHEPIERSYWYGPDDW